MREKDNADANDRSNSNSFALLLMPGVAVADTSQTTVCELAQHPQKYKSRRVSVSARVGGGGQHDLLIGDMSCPDELIVLSIPDKIIERSDIWPLWKAIYREGAIGTAGKHITGSFVGVYSDQDEEDKVPWLKGVITLEQIQNLKVQLPPGSEGRP